MFSLHLALKRANYAAGDALAAVPGGLRTEIVRFLVQDDRTPDHVRRRETAGVEGGVGKPVVGQENRQVARVIGMLRPFGL